METTKEIRLTNQTTFETIKNDFNAAFPFLKLEFFHEAHKRGTTSSAHSMYKENEKIFTVGHIRGSRRMVIHGDMKVFELEEMFEQDYGLHVQVFRKSGSIWLVTSATDGWTLEDENEAGKNMQNVISNEPEKPDYNERDIE